MRASSHGSESGIALLTTLLVLMLMSAIMAGFYAAVNSDLRATAIDRDQTQAYAAAHAGLEKLTSDLASLFSEDVSPEGSEVTALATNPPSITGFEFTEPGGTLGSGYKVTYKGQPGNPQPEDPNGSNITAGPYKGLKGIITKYPITITARSSTGHAEVRLRREIQTVAVPVFQFGVFSETDLTFYAGDNFDFGGRVHTNGNLFLSELVGFTLKFTDRITAVKEVIRGHFSNGLAVGSKGFTGVVKIPVSLGSTWRDLKLSPNEGSFTAALPTPQPTCPGQAGCNSSWVTISTGYYKSNIRNYLTGAKRLDLPIVSDGAQPIDLIRRPAVNNEDVANPNVFDQRYFSQASVRILLSDSAAEITDLPTVTAAAPIALDNWIGGPPAGYGPIDSARPPIARSIGPMAVTTTLRNDPSWSSPNARFNVNGSIPPDLKMPLLTVNGVPNVLCTGKTASSFTGCNPGGGPIIPPGSIVSATVNYGSYVVNAQATTTLNVAAGADQTISVAANTTLPFARRFFWVNNTATAPTPPEAVMVSCTGYEDTATVHKFIGCAWSGNDEPDDDDVITTNALVPQETALIGGFIKIEKQDNAGVWTDVTMEILNLGISGPNYEGIGCGDPSPNAVIRIQRLRDNGGGICDYAGSTFAYDHWPNVLYDTREGQYRDVPQTGSGSAMNVGGVMAYISLDAMNLHRWLEGVIGTTGTQAVNNNGYILYFSDRRGDHNELNADAETGEYGFEDVVNPNTAAGTPDGILDTGENVNGPTNTVLDTYGQSPANCCGNIPAGTTSPSPYDANTRPWTQFTSASGGNPGQARVNKVVLFRRALKLINGGIVGGVSGVIEPGLTVVAENPVYVQGNYNATTASANAEPNSPAAIMADAVTLLSNGWSDALSFRYPNDRTQRPATTTSYRFAVIAGKGVSFPWPSLGAPHFLFGTDGGVGNFLRLLEHWNHDSQAINYRGSIVSLFVSRQATGTFKWGPNVYSYGDRNFAFDSDFLLPSLMPPGTPVFRDVNTLTFRQILRPTQ